jgi:AraC family transcriptional regulator
MTPFGLTPEAVRAQCDVTNLKLVESIRMDETLLTTLEPPRFEDGRALLLAGLP